MNNTFKNIIIFMSGAAAGAGIMYLSIKKKFDNDLIELDTTIRNEMQHEIDILRDSIGANETETEDDEKEKVVKTKGKINYNEIIRKLDYGELEGAKNSLYDEVENSIENEPVDPDTSDEPYVISTDEFIDGRREYDKITLRYFEEDGTVMDEEEDIMPEGLALIGENNLPFAGQYEEDVLYVRNDKFGADYEVLIEHGSFSDYVR